MRDSLIGRQIVRSSRNLLIWNGILLGVIVAIFALTFRYFYNFALGPFPTSRDAIVKLQDDSLLEYFVSVESDICLETGVFFHKTHKGRHSVAGRYLLLDMDDGWLVVKTNLTSAPEKRWVGTVENLPSDARNQIPGQRRQNAKGRKEDIKPLLPVMIDATGFRLPGSFGVAFGVPLGLMAIRNLFRGAARLANPEKHPLAKALLKFGDPTEVAEKIQTEYDSDDRVEIGTATLTRSWLIHPKTFGVDLIFLGDAVWSYKSITQHYHNGVPTGKSYAGNLCDIHGSQLAVPLKNEGMCDEFVRAVVERVPWILAGFDASLAEFWKSNKPALYEIAEQRRKDLMEDLRRQREEPPPDGEPPVDEVEPV